MREPMTAHDFGLIKGFILGIFMVLLTIMIVITIDSIIKLKLSIALSGVIGTLVLFIGTSLMLNKIKRKQLREGVSI